jgi:alpha-L-fucosidase 2
MILFFRHIVIGIVACISLTITHAQVLREHNLVFDSLAKRWDEAIPLGNAWLGALIWQKGKKLRISLDRVDLWDDRPMPEIDKLKFKWVFEKVKNNQYDSVQKLGDEPYEKYPAPTKIPGAALEFDLNSMGEIVRNELNISNGLSSIRFSNGMVFNNYIHATRMVGYFSFEKIPLGWINEEKLKTILPSLIVPEYSSGNNIVGNSVEGQSLVRLGYAKGKLTRNPNYTRYHQPTWDSNYYEVLVSWQLFPGNKMIGQWTITQNDPAFLPALNINEKEPTGWIEHSKWWEDYWSRSSVSLPDKLLERQYYLDMYKFACVARSNTPPISLQAIWTADDGKLPPWKGDYHHDLNTQLSYWPGYTGNHLDLTAGYTNWLWAIRKENEKWTRNYFEMEGLNVPGVTTISGKPMGGWIQYSMSPTTAAWLAQHFYWQWKYSGDKNFLNAKVRNYIDAVSAFMIPHNMMQHANILSSSPEYHDNSIKAWFDKLTNYDLSLMHYQVEKTIELEKRSSGLGRGLAFLESVKKQLPYYDHNETGLTIAPGQNLDESHRHHAHLMPVYPLGLLNVDDSLENLIIKKSLRHLEKTGTRLWTGYSFSWAACIYARAREADNAVKHLSIFASNFCSANSFHLNGDQKGGQYSNFTYRPFTLEGNFAFAQGIHELLIQSHKGYIEVFPATPASWKDVSFSTLRAEGAFLVSAKRVGAVIDEIKVTAEAGGELMLKFPFKTWLAEGVRRKKVKIDNRGLLRLKMRKGQTIVFRNAYE